MWFDAVAALADIEGEQQAYSEACPSATSATSATRAPQVAKVADVANFQCLKPSSEPIDRMKADESASFPHGTACDLGDTPRTWTGRVVSLAAWRRMTEWEKHGPNGRLWCGLC